MNPDLTLALELADLADRISSERFRAADLVVETKPDMTPVSEADKEIERVLRERISVSRPHHAVVGEEEGVKGSGDCRWIIDPIDGTKNFIRGIPVWGTLIGLEVEGQMTVGVASAPALQRRWWAARGEGAFADGRPIHVSKVERLNDAQLSFASIETWDRHGRGPQIAALTRKVWRSRGFGDFWQHVLVAEGAVDVAVEPEVSLWDLAALQVIVEEAGGQFTDLGGVARADGGNVATSNGLLHDEVLATLRG
jgi:histidinol-phosphatase